METEGTGENTLEIHLVLDAEFLSLIAFGDFTISPTEFSVNVFHNSVRCIQWVDLLLLDFRERLLMDVYMYSFS